jgi:hypothetical protein
MFQSNMSVFNVFLRIFPGKSEEKMENHGKSQDNHGKVLFYAFFPGKSEEKH